jgi:hypothetical protein
MFHELTQGDALWPLLFNCSVGYAIMSLQVNQKSLKLNGTHQLLVYAAGVNILGGSVHTVKKNNEGSFLTLALDGGWWSTPRPATLRVASETLCVVRAPR